MIVLYTSAIIPNKYEIRKEQYIKSYNALINYFNKDDVKIVECFKEDSDFLEYLGSDVLITKKHDNNIKNKGVLEILSMIEFFKKNEIDNDTMILKITGRYTLINNTLVDVISDNKFDFYGRLMDSDRQVFTGCFAMRKGIFLDYLNTQDLDYLERKSINIEMTLLEYLQSNKINCNFLNKIDIEAPIFGTGDIDFNIL